MRKIVAIIILLISFLILYFLQVNFFNWFTIAGVKPNLFVIFTLCISLFAGMKIGIPAGIIIGLFCDIILGKTMGISATMLGIIGIVGGYLEKNFSKESRLTIMLMVIGCTFLYEIGFYILQIIELSISIELIPFIKTLAIEVLYNSILTIILYPIIQKLGHKLEITFKEQNILTTYF